MQTVIIVIHLMIVVALIGLVLLQRSEGGGLGIGSGGGGAGGFLSSRGTANILTRTTAILAIGFFLTSLVLSWLAGYQRRPASILDGAPVQQNAPAPSGGSLLDQLRGQGQSGAPTAPPAPAAPSAPQVPQSQ